MANNTFVELTVRPQDVDEFEFESNGKEKGEPLLTHISQGDIHPSDLQEKAHLPFVGWHGSHDGDYRACIVICNGNGNIETYHSDNAGFMVEEVGPGDLSSLRCLCKKSHTDKSLKKASDHLVRRYRFMAKMLHVMDLMRATSSRNKKVAKPKGKK
jgi:hypothetical protein